MKICSPYIAAIPPRRERGAKGPEEAPETAGPGALGEEVAGEPEAEGAVEPVPEGMDRGETERRHHGTGASG